MAGAVRLDGVLLVCPAIIIIWPSGQPKPTLPLGQIRSSLVGLLVVACMLRVLFVLGAATTGGVDTGGRLVGSMSGQRALSGRGVRGVRASRYGGRCVERGL